MLNRKVSWSGLHFKTIILAPALRRAGRDRSGGCCNERLVAWAGVTTVIGGEKWSDFQSMEFEGGLDESSREGERPRTAAKLSP